MHIIYTFMNNMQVTLNQSDKNIKIYYVQDDQMEWKRHKSKAQYVAIIYTISITLTHAKKK